MQCIKKVFAAEQAKDFVNHYDFVHQQPNTNYGMSATVFKDESESGNYTIAVRGTEPPGAGDNNLTDLLVDLFGVVLEGQAKIQAIQAFHYYKQLTTATTEQIEYTSAELKAVVKLIRTNSNPISNDVSTEDELAANTFLQQAFGDEQGLGLMTDAETINFTGHSLGGHVAYLLSGLVQESQSQIAVGDIMTYNAPGEGSLLYELLNWVTPGTIWSAEGPIGSKHLSFYGEGGIEVTALSGKVIGTPVPTFIEEETGPSVNHAIDKLSDSLALYNLLENILPASTDNTIQQMKELKPIFYAISQKPTEALKQVNYLAENFSGEQLRNKR